MAFYIKHIYIPALEPNLLFLLNHINVINTFWLWVRIEPTLVSHVNKSLFLFVKQSIVLHMLDSIWDLEGNTFVWRWNRLNVKRNLKQKVEYVCMAAKFEIATAHIHHLAHFVLPEKLLIGFLTSERSKNIVRMVREICFYFCFGVTAALLEMIQ